MKRIFELFGCQYTFTCDEGTEISFDSLGEEREGVRLYRVAFRWGAMLSPKKITLSYRFPCRDLYGMWDPIEKRRHLGVRWSDHYGRTESRLGAGMPLKGLFSRRGENSYLLALSDVKSPIAVKMGASEREGVEEVRIEFFTALTGPFSDYETLIRVDTRKVPFDEAVRDARAWFEGLGYRAAYTPESARDPIYSTWYSYLKTVTADAVLGECRRAAELGLKTVIVDDGWQTDVSDGGAYAYCGDWEPSEAKFGDLRAFTDRVHALGMKVMLWFSVPFIGYSAKNYETFRGKYLYDLEDSCCSVLDPRYPEVREFLVKTYADAVTRWGLDGLKLDFIDRFKANGTVKEGMDFVSVEDAVECLLREISEGLRAIDPEILIEFRQPYFGPVISAYGNMIRVWDCPLDGVTNKNQSLNLRLVSGVAVHADMIYWHETDSPESAAVQLIGTLFSVPQISVRLDAITEAQAEVLRNYLDFWNAHRETICDGRLHVELVENGYGYAESSLGGETVALTSACEVIELPSGCRTYECFNLTARDELILCLGNAKRAHCTVYDCTGACLAEPFELTVPLRKVRVPLGGRLKVTLG